MLWLDAHAPEHKIIPPQVQARLDAGNEFGDNAMGIFGEFVETTAYREDGRLHYAAMIEKTQALMQAGAHVICEAAFSWYGNYCAVDILKKEGDGYAVYEVKNTYFPRREFICDLGFQRLLLRKNGVNVHSCNLILRGDAPPKDYVPCEPFPAESEELLTYNGFIYKLANVSNGARKVDYLASSRVFELGRLKRKDAPMPALSVGEQCEKPYRCWYFDYCHK